MRVLLTAGFDRALHVVALAELLTRAGHDVAHVLVVSPFDLRRARGLVRQRGTKALGFAARRIAGFRSRNAPDALDRLLEQQGIAERSLRTWCSKRGVARSTVASLDSNAAIDIVRASRVDGVVYGGGGILRAEFIDACGGRVLNAHAGPLPDVRGMNALEWSLLLGKPPAVTIHVIDCGIDTGPALEQIPVPVHAGDTIDALRARCTVLGVEGLVRNVARLAGPLPVRASHADAGRQCFVMASVLRELVEHELRGGTHARRRVER
jgi:folate-dependent phosphoribosylglycinamide formyltransferase PurN